MKITRVHLSTDQIFKPGPSVRFHFDQQGHLGYASKGDVWAQMRYKDPATNETVPLAYDSHQKAPYFEQHWPAISAAMRGKRGPVAKLIQAGHGDWEGPPDEMGQRIPIAFQVLENGPAFSDEALLDIYANAAPYANLRHERKSLLDIAVGMKLFRLAEHLWNQGIPFSKRALEKGSTLGELASPSIGGNGACLKNVVIRLTPKTKEDTDNWEEKAATAYIAETRKWIERLDQAGTQWNPQHSLTFSRKNEDPVELAALWPVSIAYCELKNYNTIPHAKAEDMDPLFYRNATNNWRKMWFSYLDRIPAEDVTCENNLFNGHRLSLIETMRELGCEHQAVALEQSALQQNTGTAINAPTHRIARL